MVLFFKPILNQPFIFQGKGNVADVKFVDFQITRIANPLFDLLFFLCASLSPQVLEKNMDQLLDVYFKKFIEVLDKTECNSSLFRRSNFEYELEVVAKKMLFYSISALKFMTMDVSSNVVANEVIKGTMVDGNEQFFERTWAIVSKYISKKWL